MLLITHMQSVKEGAGWTKYLRNLPPFKITLDLLLSSQSQ